MGEGELEWGVSRWSEWRESMGKSEKAGRLDRRIQPDPTPGVPDSSGVSSQSVDPPRCPKLRL